METAGRIELFLALVRFVSLTARTPVLDMAGDICPQSFTFLLALLLWRTSGCCSEVIANEGDQEVFPLDHLIS
jgi:hypothetical protein